MDYPSPEFFFDPEMPGKCWITIIRNISFHKSRHSIWMFCFVLDSKDSDCNIERILLYIKHVFIPISSGYENSSKRTQRMAIDATLASSEQSVQHITVSV